MNMSYFELNFKHKLLNYTLKKDFFSHFHQKSLETKTSTNAEIEILRDFI